MKREGKVIKDRGYSLVKEIFKGYLKNTKDLEISSEDIEETFLSLWIFIHKKNPQILVSSTPVDIPTAQDFYNVHVCANVNSKKYLGKLLISFRQ